MKPGASVSEVLAEWDKNFSPAVGGTKGVTVTETPTTPKVRSIGKDKPDDAIRQKIEAEGRKLPAAGKAKPSNRTKVKCPGCGESYNGRATWVKNGDKQCFRCKTKGGK